MSSKKLTDIDIVRVLNCCYDKDEIILSFYEDNKLKVDLTVQDIIDLLNRHQAENEELKKLLESRHKAIEFLEGQLIGLPDGVRAEALKEFVTKAEEKAKSLKDCTGTEVVFTVDDLYDLLKEMR